MKKNKNAEYDGPVNYRLKATILEVVENQLSMSELPIVRETFDRLRKNGDDAQLAKEKIASVLLGQMYDVLKDNIPCLLYTSPSPRDQA